MFERFRDALTAFRHGRQIPRELDGEVALSDPLRLFGGLGSITTYNPSVLATRKGLAVFDRMRLDDQVKAAMYFKKLAVLSTGWDVVSPEGRSPDWDRRLLIESELQRIKPTLDTVLLQIMTALDYGYSVTEKTFREIHGGDHDGLVGLESLKTKRPHSFTFAVDEMGNILDDGVLQVQPGVRENPARLPREKFVLLSYQSEFGNPYGTSDLEAAYRSWWSKDNAYKYLAMMLERWGIPPLFALYNPNRYRGAALDNLKKIVKNLQAATSGIIPRPAKDDMDMWAPEIAGQVSNVFIPAIEMMNKDIARALLMPGLLGASPDQAGGSFARARVTFEVFMFAVEYLRNVVADHVVNEQIIRPLIEINYGPDEDAPKFRFLPLTESGRAELLKTWGELVGLGVVETTDQDESHIRDVLEFPEKSGVVKKPPAPPDDDVLDGNDDTESEDEEPAVALKALAERVPTRFERRIDLVQIQSAFDAVDAESTARLRGDLLKARDRMMDQTRKAATVDTALLDKVSFGNRGDFRKSVQAMLLDAFDGGRETLRDDVSRETQNREDPVSFEPRAALRYLRGKALTIAGSVSDRLTADVKEVLLFSLKNGESTQEAVGRIRDTFEPWVGDASKIRGDDVVQPSRLETLVRTNVTDAFNQGRLVEMRDPALAEFMTGVQYSAILDTRTTEVCRHLDGKIFRLEDPSLDRLTPPNHFSCRSLLVPVTIDEPVEESDFATPGQVGKGVELAGKGFV